MIEYKVNHDIELSHNLLGRLQFSCLGTTQWMNVVFKTHLVPISSRTKVKAALSKSPTMISQKN